MWETVVIGCSTSEKVKHFLLQLRKKGGVVNTVNTVVAVTTAKT